MSCNTRTSRVQTTYSRPCGSNCSPVDGEVIEVNAELPNKLELLNDDPYNDGWILKVRLSSEDSLGKLMDHAAYQKQCEEAG